MKSDIGDGLGPPLAHVVVNALSATARPKLSLVMRLVLGPSISLLRRRFGGLWVGGDAYLWPDRLIFAPNELNAGLHQDELGWSIPLQEITSVSCKPATITDIIEIAHAAGVARIRCYGAQAFMQRIEAAKSATQRR